MDSKVVFGPPNRWSCWHGDSMTHNRRAAQHDRHLLVLAQLINGTDFCLGARSGALLPLLGQGIFTQDGRQWKHSRDVLRRPFVKMHYQNLTGFGEHTDDLVTNLQRTSGIVDLQPYFFRFTLATTTALIFGQPIKDYESETQHDFAEAFDYASIISGMRIRLAQYYWLYHPSKYSDSNRLVKRYATDFICQALSRSDEEKSSKDDKYAFIEDLYKEYKDVTKVRDQLIHVLIAGRDTTAALLSWTFFLLVRHPHVLQRLQKEVHEILGEEGVLDRRHIQKMSWLRCVINETHRLYPQLPFNVREAVRSAVLPCGGGPDGASPVLIPKGLGIGWSTYHMHRLRSLYGDDAGSYRPERWEDGKLDNIGFGFMPFHGGPRLCLGSMFILSFAWYRTGEDVIELTSNLCIEDFALTEASCAIVKILQTFPNIRLPEAFSTVPTGQEKQSIGLLVVSAEGCQVRLE